MSWVKVISDSIASKAPMKETMRLIQGGLSAVTVQVQHAIDETHPADYPLLLAVLSMTVKSFRQSLPPDAQFLAQLIEQLTTSVAVTVPETFLKPKEGEQ